jgi:hypothetical protein
MDVVSTKILKDYGPAIQEVLNMWNNKVKAKKDKRLKKREGRRSQSSISSSSDSDSDVCAEDSEEKRE